MQFCDQIFPKTNEKKNRSKSSGEGKGVKIYNPGGGGVWGFGSGEVGGEVGSGLCV